MSNNIGKTVLVTGGAKGIGREISRTMAEAGYDIAINWHHHEQEAFLLKEEIESMGQKAECFYADMSNLEDIKNLYEKIYASFDRLDIVINNAGIGVEAYFLDTTEEMFDRMTAVDWKGLFFSSQNAAKKMIEKGTHGVIINISSNQSVGCWPRSTVYAPTKAAVDKFTKNAAMELIPYNIRMCSIAPGYTDVGWNKSDNRWAAEKRLPMKRFASMKEIARACVYLSSDDASYITGTTLFIDGGALLPVVAENDFVKLSD